jgi:capsular exopolysaccharide synthesis family protein
MSKFFDAFKQTQPSVADAVFTDRPEQTGANQHDDLILRAAEIHALPHRPVKSPASAPPVQRPVIATREVRVRVSADSPLLPFDGADEAAAEQYRMIRTRIVHDARQPRVLCISSPGMGDGKSVNSVNIAGALALKQETSVLLVDCDLRRPALARTLGLPQSPGLSEVLTGKTSWQDAIVRIAEAPNLCLMPAGEITTVPAELLDSARWRAISQAFRSNFTFVIMDSPPIGKVADFDLIQAVCDGILLVVREGHSDRKQLLKSLETLPKERLTGVIMNCVTPWFLWKTGDIYGSYYGSDNSLQAREAKQQ